MMPKQRLPWHQLFVRGVPFIFFVFENDFVLSDASLVGIAPATPIFAGGDRQIGLASRVGIGVACRFSPVATATSGWRAACGHWVACRFSPVATATLDHVAVAASLKLVVLAFVAGRVVSGSQGFTSLVLAVVRSAPRVGASQREQWLEERWPSSGKTRSCSR